MSDLPSPQADGSSALARCPALRRVDPPVDLSFVGRTECVFITKLVECGGERGTFLCRQLLDSRDPRGLEQSQIVYANPAEFTELTRVNQLLHAR